MRFVVPTLGVEELDGFKNDALKRKAFGDALLNLVSKSTDPLVISLDGKWGEGKTTFVKMWRGSLSDAGIPSIYFDAFENDYVDDAFMAVASAITSYVESNSEDSKFQAEFKDKAKKVGVQLLSWSAKIGIKAATLGVVDSAEIEALGDIKDDLATGSSNAIADFIKERLSSHRKEVETIQSFKKLLSEFPSRIIGNKSERLIVIVDELDRCKPPFAVGVIEKIKHFFSVQNVIFVLVMHKEQLEEAIKCVYGAGIDAHTYLQKFISLEASVPKRTASRYDSDLRTYNRKLLELHELETWGDNRNIIDCIDALAPHFKLSLRQLEKVYTNIAIVYSTFAQNHLRVVPIVVFVCVIKVINPRLFARMLSGDVSYAVLCKEVGIVDLDESKEDQRKLSWMLEWLGYSLWSDSECQALGENDPRKRFSSAIFQYNVNRQSLIPLFCTHLNFFAVNNN
jgi:hypothetical protein